MDAKTTMQSPNKSAKGELGFKNKNMFDTLNKTGQTESGTKLLKAFWETISWWFYMKRIEFALWFAYKKQNHRIRKYCNHNRHKFFNDYIKVTKSGFGIIEEQVVIDVKYFTCVDCRARFFVTEEDKKKYLDYQQNEIRDFNKMLGGIK